MKTWKKVLLLIAILLLALGATLTQLAHRRGDSYLANLSFGVSGNYAYDQKGYTVCRSGETDFAAKDVRALSLDWNAGSVTVERYSGSTVLVREEAKRALKEDECLRYKLSGGELSILPCANRVSSLPEKHLTVFIPQGLVLEGLAVDVSSANVKVSGVETEKAILLESGSGTLQAEDCRCGELRLESGSGEQRVLRTEVGGALRSESGSGAFRAETLVCAEADIETNSGDKSIDGLLCDRLKLSASSGAVRGTALVCGFVESESSSGNVSLTFAAAPTHIGIETSSGDVTLTLPQGTGVNLLFDSSSGKLGGELVRGDLPIDVETSSGDLTIAYR